MKKYIILISLLLTAYLSFSQSTGIPTTQIQANELEVMSWDDALDTWFPRRAILELEEVVDGGEVIGIAKYDGSTRDTILFPQPTLLVTTQPLYEYREIWAEESGAISNNSTQWSYGNGDVGAIGIPVTSGWEITEGYIQSDFGGAPTESLSIIIEDFRPSTAGTNLGTFQITAAGNGQNENASFTQVFTTPIIVPDNAVIGFRTQTEIGTWSSTRVGVRLRRQIGTYVSSVSLN